MASFSELLRKPFSWLFAGRSTEDRVAAYIIREHERDRPVSQILDDPYVKYRCTPNQIARVLERPEVIRSLGEATAAAARAEV